MQTAGVWPRLQNAASWAPSPHNTQPWLVHPRSDTEAELYVPAGRTLPYTDASGAFAANALGIFVEALDVVAAAEGLTVEAEPLYPKLGAGAEERPLFARLRLAERSEPPRFPVELLARRQTARGAYDRRPADGAALAALQEIVREAGHEAWFTSDRELVDWVVGLNADTLFYDLDDDRTRAEIGRWIRTSQAAARRTGDGSPRRHSGFPARSSASSSSTIACSRAGRCEASCAGSSCGRHAVRPRSAGSEGRGNCLRTGSRRGGCSCASGSS
jgi:hypothetical protein